MILNVNCKWKERERERDTAPDYDYYLHHHWHLLSLTLCWNQHCTSSDIVALRDLNLPILQVSKLSICSQLSQEYAEGTPASLVGIGDKGKHFDQLSFKREVGRSVRFPNLAAWFRTSGKLSKNTSVGASPQINQIRFVKDAARHSFCCVFNSPGDSNK